MLTWGTATIPTREHVDTSAGHVDGPGPHTDTHTDTPHVDTDHTDVAHLDTAHADTPHGEFQQLTR